VLAAAQERAEEARGVGSRRRAEIAAIAGVAAAAAVPRLLDCFRRPIDYNGFWHVFIARNLSREWLNLQHPPAYLVLLRISDTVSRSVLSYRFWGFAAGVGSVFLAGLLLLELRCRLLTAVVGALVLGFSFNPIRLSNEVESYSVCVFLILASFMFYVRIVAPEWAGAGPRAAFAILTSLAIAFHYFAGLYAAACVGAPFVLAALVPDYRKAMSKNLAKRWLADVATILPPLLVGACLYEVQAKRWVMPLSSLPSFYYEPLRDSVSSFLVRNLRESFNLFAPIAFPRARVALPILAAFLLAVAWWTVRERRQGRRQALRLLPLIFLAALLAGGMVLGLRGLYPFGGQMRHQFLIFLFALLAGMVGADAAVARLSPIGRITVLGGLVAILAADFLVQLPLLLHPDPDRLRPILEARDADFREVGRVSVDQFGLVGLFTRYYASGFRFAERVSNSPPVDRYEIGSGDGRFDVLALRDWWIFEFWDDRVFDELSRTWSKRGETCNGLLRVSGTVFDQPARPRPDERFRSVLEARVRAAAVAHGLSVRRVAASDFLDVYAVFCR
jgi:hypothetical protein